MKVLILYQCPECGTAMGLLSTSQYDEVEDVFKCKECFHTARRGEEEKFGDIIFEMKGCLSVWFEGEPCQANG